MFSWLFHKKAVGFKVNTNSIKYAFIKFNKNKINIEEAQQFDINCKTALHRLQYLLQKYPSCCLIDSSNFLLNSSENKISNPKDRKQIIKNKIESLLPQEKVLIFSPFFLKKNTQPLFALKKNEMKKQQELLSKFNIKAQKMIVSSESLQSLSSKHPPSQKSVLIVFNSEKVEILYVSPKDEVLSYSFSSAQLTHEHIEKKVLKTLYSFFKNLPIPPIELHGDLANLESIISKLQSITSQEVKHSSWGDFEKKAPEYLEEVGAAFSILKNYCINLQKETFSSVYKLYKTAFITNGLIVVALFIISFFYWNQKLQFVEQENKNFFEQGLVKLSKPKKVYSSEQILTLKDILDQKKRETPSFPFHPQTYSVSDVLVWLSEISKELAAEQASTPFVIDSFKYALISSPSIKKPRSPYKIKVSFSFAADSSMAARSIREKIFKANDIVDKKKKVEWVYHNSRYNVSFFLKNNLSREEK